MEENFKVVPSTLETTGDNRTWPKRKFGFIKRVDKG